VTSATGRPPGRPRSAESHQAIVQATLELLLEGGYRALTMEQVRARSGVGKATIYRRWQSKEDLVATVIGYLHQDLQAPDTGSLAGDYEALAREVLTGAEKTGVTTFMPRLLADAVGNPDLHAIFYANLVAPRRAAMREVLERAVARGEVRADVDLELAIDLLVGPVLYRILISAGDVSTLVEPRVLVETVLAGLGQPRAS
jgi:AcrR family transcriptional regulator